MRSLLIAMVLAVATAASAEISSDYIRGVIVASSRLNAYRTHEVEAAIDRIIDRNPLGRNIELDKAHRHIVATSILKAHMLTGVDWRVLLAISYVESNLCSRMRGDRKPNTNTNADNLYSYWSVGCMQVNMRWWGPIIDRAGLKQADLLDVENGIIIGALILKMKIDKYGTINGIRRYNGAGPESYEYLNKVQLIVNVIERK